MRRNTRISLSNYGSLPRTSGHFLLKGETIICKLHFKIRLLTPSASSPLLPRRFPTHLSIHSLRSPSEVGKVWEEFLLTFYIFLWFPNNVEKRESSKETVKWTKTESRFLGLSLSKSFYMACTSPTWSMTKGHQENWPKPDVRVT